MSGQIEFKDIANSIQTLEESFRGIERLMNVNKKKELVRQKEEAASASDFWTDTQAAQKHLQELKSLKKDIQRWEQLKTGLEDAKAHYELAREAGQTQELGEIVSLISLAFSCASGQGDPAGGRLNTVPFAPPPLPCQA